MRKTIIGPDRIHPAPHSDGEWLAIDEIREVEVTSEDAEFPIESALIPGKGPGWRAAEPGKQTIRIVLDKPRRIRWIRLEFFETEIERTQEFTLAWSTGPGQPFREIVRQQWNFNPQGSTHELEDYQVELNGVSVLELTLKPDLNPSDALATLAVWRLA